jgi:hypothetical protein
MDSTYLSNDHDWYSADFVKYQSIDQVHEGGPSIPEAVQHKRHCSVEVEAIVEENLVVVDHQATSRLNKAPSSVNKRRSCNKAA